MRNRIHWFVLASALMHASLIGLLPEKAKRFYLDEQGNSILGIEIMGLPKNTIGQKATEIPPQPQPKSGPPQAKKKAAIPAEKKIEAANVDKKATHRVVQSQPQQPRISTPSTEFTSQPVKNKAAAESTGKPNEETELASTEKLAMPVDPLQWQRPSPDNRVQGLAAEGITGARENPPQSLNETESLSGGKSRRTSGSEQIARLVRNEFSRFFYYPAAAKRRNWEGKVVLGFVVAPSGRLEQIHIDKSSGYTVLDKAAKLALKKVKSESDFALAAGGLSIRQSLPVVYKLLND